MTVDKRNHVTIRREASEAFTKDIRAILDKTPQESQDIAIADVVEESMILAERRGINEVVGRLGRYILKLKEKLAYGPANHVEQAIRTFNDWYENSAEFVTKAEFDDLLKSGHIKPPTEEKLIEIPRKFIGQ